MQPLNCEREKSRSEVITPERIQAHFPSHGDCAAPVTVREVPESKIEETQMHTQHDRLVVVAFPVFLPIERRELGRGEGNIRNWISGKAKTHGPMDCGSVKVP